MDRILVVDDEKSMRDFLEILLQKEGYQVVTAARGKRALEVLQDGPVDLVITDIRMPSMDGIDVLEEVKAHCPQVPVLMITAYAEAETAVEAMKKGAYDYIIKPFKVDELKLIIRNALEKKHLEEENTLLKREILERGEFLQIVWSSEKMQPVFEIIRKVADSRSTVLITGESGTGKELVARAIHAYSSRKDKPFVTVNCSAMPETLLESELFGHVKGAFTGAEHHKKGLLELADGGTFFLDEIGTTPLSIQVKLLRVLQEREFKQVGGVQDIKVDVRVIAATNQDLDQAVASGQFREDLFYRLDVITVEIPPLRERREDISLLADHFLTKYCLEAGKIVKRFDPEAVKFLKSYPWPGNVRELENVVERAVALESGDMILPTSLPDKLRQTEPGPSGGMPKLTTDGLDLEKTLDTLEKEILIKALEKSDGVKSRAAELLHLSFRSLRYRLKKHDLDSR